MVHSDAMCRIRPCDFCVIFLYSKVRALPHISGHLKRTALKWMMIEQNNIELLSKPYLSQVCIESALVLFIWVTVSIAVFV